MVWPTAAGSEPGDLGIDWGKDAEGTKSVLENTSCFKAPPEKFLPVLLDLYNGQCMMLQARGAPLIPLPEKDSDAYDELTAYRSLVQARDIACEALKGQYVDVKVGPREGSVNYTRAIMLRAMVVDDKQQILFELDSTI